MSSAKAIIAPMTPEEYLAWEGKQLERHEYIDGVLRAMSGGSWNHNLIMGNLMRDVGMQIERTNCKSFSLSHHVQASSTRYFYPDLGIVCETPLFGEQEALLNPVVLLEVLSPSTERYDRVNKFEWYREIESLQEYFLVYQDMALVEASRRSREGSWVGSTFTAYLGLEAEVVIESVGVRIPLRKIYAGVELPSIVITPET